QDMMDDYVFHNAQALDELKKGGTLLKRFPDEVLQAMQRESEQVLGELAAQSELNGRIWTSMQAFQALATSMHTLSEKELYDLRCAWHGQKPDTCCCWSTHAMAGKMPTKLFY